MAIQVRPLTPRRWDDFVELFGPERGANGGCWCMYWRTDCSQKAFHALPRDLRRDEFAGFVGQRRPPGLLAYEGGECVGWVSVAPRAEFPRFNRTKASRPEEDSDLDNIWAVNCFFVRATHRRRGVTLELLHGAIAFARRYRARAIDAAPLDVARQYVAGEGYVGAMEQFLRAGFAEIERHAPSRPLMRLELR